MYVTWHDAIASCRWLTEQFRNDEGIPAVVCERAQREGWEVILPSEAEWERAARGTDGRIYPWGDEWEDDHANIDEIGIGRPSAVGSFPRGVSPSGCLDMAGNVWEWTRSLWGKEYRKPDFVYPYTTDDKCKNLDIPNDVFCMLRGGSCFEGRKGARCVYRLRNLPGHAAASYGFRVVVLPKNSER